MPEWNLFEQQPMKLIHPEGFDFFVAAVSHSKNGIIWWNADPIIDSNLPNSAPAGSGFAENPIDDPVIEWSEKDNGWHVTRKENPSRIYKFILPDKKMLAEWEKYGQYVPDREKLDKMASVMGD